ncbi:MAG: hypothetical protein JXL84_10990 [Deltaproteobacteria bacterium]|nr:hypothetical protein [Deltaproteobacteria bacterium]
MRKTAVLVLMLFLFLALLATAFAQGVNETLSLTLPRLDWSLAVPGPGFVLEQKYMIGDGTGARFMAVNRKTSMALSGSLERALRDGTPRECRDHYWQNLQKGPFRMEQVRMSEMGEMATVEYFIREVQGIPVNQRNLYGYFVRGGYWMYLHLSKPLFQPRDETLFRSLLDRARIVPKTTGSTWDVGYRVSDRHSLFLSVPRTWADEIDRPRENSPPTITYWPREDPSSKVMVTPIWSQKGVNPDFNRPKRIRALVEDGGRALLPQAVEKELVLREVRGRSAHGFYYTLTDRAPKSGEHKYMTQGGVGVADLLLMFTLFFNDRDSTAIQPALEMLTSARSSP